MKLALYGVTALNPTAEASEIVTQINALVISRKANLDRDRAQAVLDEIASAEVQARHALKVVETDFDMDHDE